MADNDAMTKTERDELRRIIAGREKLAKASIDQRKAELLADAEQQLATIYKFDDERWAEVTAAAEGAVKAADDYIARVCREQGIPEEFRPGLTIGWYGRGENAAAGRRAEIRKVVQTRLDASAREAKVAIETAALERREALALGALESAEARAFMESMPTVQQLMPRLNVRELEGVTGLGLES
jgi:hypothetical protein